MMNKALEVIEARWLFDLAPEQIEVVIHPQSIIHSMVVCRDRSVLAQLGTADMRVPIAYGLAYPERIESGAPTLDFAPSGRSRSSPPIRSAFPDCGWRGRHSRAPPGSTAVLNAANEVGVAAFLAGTIRFDQIHNVNAATVEAIVPEAGAASRSTPCSTSTPVRASGRLPELREGPHAMITTLLAFVLTLAVLIVIHEYGHYRVAVACGVRCCASRSASVACSGDASRRPKAPSSWSAPCRSVVTCACSTSAKARSARPISTARSTASRSGSAPPSSPRARPRTCCSRSCCMRRPTGSASTSRRRCWTAGRRERRGARRAHAGDWVRAWSTDGVDWHDLRSLTDLRWEVTQAVLHGERLHLMVTDRDGRASVASTSISRRSPRARSTPS